MELWKKVPIAAKVVECDLCKDEFPEDHMEQHLVAVHGIDGPKEMYTTIVEQEDPMVVLIQVEVYGKSKPEIRNSKSK